MTTEMSLEEVSIECGECADKQVCPYCGGEEPDIFDCLECQGDGTCHACREE